MLVSCVLEVILESEHLRPVKDEEIIRTEKKQTGQIGLCLLPLIQRPGQVTQLFALLGTLVFVLFLSWVTLSVSPNDSKRQQFPVSKGKGLPR